jgi:hypothetical protein
MKKKFNYFVPEGMTVSTQAPSPPKSVPQDHNDLKAQEQELMRQIREQKRVLGVNLDPIIETKKGLATNDISADVVAIRVLNHNFLNLIAEAKDEVKRSNDVAKISIGGKTPQPPEAKGSLTNTVTLGGAPSPQLSATPSVPKVTVSSGAPAPSDISVKGVGEVLPGMTISGAVKTAEAPDIAGQFQAHEHELKALAYLIEVFMYLMKVKEQYNLKVARDLLKETNSEVKSLDLKTVEIALKKHEEKHAGLSKEEKDKDIQYTTIKKSLESQKKYLELTQELSKNPANRDDPDFMQQLNKAQEDRNLYLGSLREKMQKQMKENEGEIKFQGNYQRSGQTKDVGFAILKGSLENRNRIEGLMNKEPEVKGLKDKASVAMDPQKKETQTHTHTIGYKPN